MKHHIPTLSRTLRRAGQTAACIAALAGTLTAAPAAEASETTCDGFYYIQNDADWSQIDGCTHINGHLLIKNVSHFNGASELQTVSGWLYIHDTNAQSIFAPADGSADSEGVGGGSADSEGVGGWGDSEGVGGGSADSEGVGGWGNSEGVGGWGNSEGVGGGSAESGTLVNGFGALTYVGNLAVANNPVLQSAQFTNLNNAGQLFILGNPELEAALFPALQNIALGMQSTQARFWVGYNQSLTQLYFPNLGYAPEFTLEHNEQFVAGFNFQSLDVVERNITIRHNDALHSFVFHTLDEVEQLNIKDNASLKVFAAPGINSLNQLAISNNASLKYFHLPYLHSIYGWAMISGNDSLTGLTMWNLQAVGGMYLAANDSLTALSFPQLEEVWGIMAVASNELLTDISFPQLASIGYHLYVVANASLTELDGLHDLTLGAALVVQGNPNVSACEFYALWDSITFENDQFAAMPISEEEALTCTPGTNDAVSGAGGWGDSEGVGGGSADNDGAGGWGDSEGVGGGGGY